MADDIRSVVDADSALEEPTWTRAHASTLPASGAWRPGDPSGDRQFLRTFVDRTFVLEGGGQLRDVTVAFETWGTLAADGSNAVLVCHALTGDGHAAGRGRSRPPHRPGGGTRSSAPAGRSTPTAGSWSAPTCSAGARAPPARRRPAPTGRPSTARRSRW